MFKKIFSTKVLVSLALIIGLVLGYSINDVLTAPKIEELQDKTRQLEDLQEACNQLQGSYDSLEENHTSLMDDYETLKATSVPVSQYNSLSDGYQELERENEGLNDELDQLQEELIETNMAKDLLQTEYTRLLEKYNEIRVLSWTFFIVKQIEVNLTTVKNEYQVVENIAGTMKMTYLNGEPFNGTFSLILWKVSPGVGVTSEPFQIYGETDYVFVDSFRSGPGSYKLRVYEIKDHEGNRIASYSDLVDYSIPISLG